MQLIPLDPASGARSMSSQRAVNGIIASIGDSRFGEDALAHLNTWMPVCWWSIYELFEDRPPSMYASGSYGVTDGTRDSFSAYRAGLYERDRTFSPAWDALRGDQAALTHWEAGEIPTPHRDAIYSRHRLRARLSLVKRRERGLLAVNLYRTVDQPAFAERCIGAIQEIADPLLACVTRHLALTSRDVRSDGSREKLSVLTKREFEVCQRLLKGWTHDGVAADLGLATGTVKTYRDRAFDKLGIQHRHQLFALVASRESPD